MTCIRCNLYEHCNYICLPGAGNKKNKLMIVGGAPGFEDDMEGGAFFGPLGELLNECLEYAGIDRSGIYITNAVKCRPLGDKKPTAKQINACRYWLEKEIEEIQPKAILVLGATALYSVLKEHNLSDSKNKNIFEKDGVKYKVTYHPAYALRNPKAKDVIKEDIKQFFKSINISNQDSIDYNIVDPTNIIIFMRWLNKVEEIALDIETTEFNAFCETSQVVSIGLSDGIEQWILLLNYPNRKSMNILLVKDILKIITNKYIICHNGKFDCIFLSRKYNIKLYPSADTMLLYHLIDENGSLELKILLSKVFDDFVDYNISLDTKTGKDTDLNSHCRYLAKDAYYTYHLYRYTRNCLEGER